ncbi:ThiF family adenylyltransferase [Desulfosarcina sp. OttesenSCG-928-A07]|nr:ThiF family adenylyltransferase [Desulfosarcina sp. OttesenSCG-928-A07]
MHPWFASLSSISPEELILPRAQQFARYVNLHGNDSAQVTGIMRFPANGMEIMIIDIKTGCGQHPVYPLKRTETLAIVFYPRDTAPSVLSTREDFPDTPHQNWVPENCPFSICIDDRAWEEASLTYTSAELLQRIFLWFTKTSKGELHGADQPVDPNFFTSIYDSLLLESNFFTSTPEETNFRYRLDPCGPLESARFYTLKRIDQNEPPHPVDFSAVTLSIAPEDMTRIRKAPNNLSSLNQVMLERKIDLVHTLKEHIRALDSSAYGSFLILIVKIPMLHPRTHEVSGTNIMAFLSLETIGEVGKTLGILDRDPSKPNSYGALIQEQPILPNTLETISFAPCPVHQDFDPRLAALLAGRPNNNILSTLLVGAGAVGSGVIEPLFREGRFKLTILDDDILLPHNLARHTLSRNNVGKFKAESLAKHLQAIMPTLAPDYIVINILKISDDPKALSAIKSSELILDATASVPASRCICDLDSNARRLSFFYNPSGTVAALLVEDKDRKIDLRCLEAHMYSTVLHNETVKDFWNIPAVMTSYAGSCRALTTRLAASQVQILSGLIAKKIGQVLKQADAKMIFWGINEDGSVNKIESIPGEPLPVTNNGGWQVRILPYVGQQIIKKREEKLPNETGGSLLGIIDIPKKRVEVLGIIPPPEDSIESPVGFTRGTAGLYDVVMAAIARCNNEIRYIGEWHSHPEHMRNAPSPTDIEQLTFLTFTLGEDGYPGIQIIAGDDGLNVVIGQMDTGAR